MAVIIYLAALLIFPQQNQSTISSWQRGIYYLYIFLSAVEFLLLSRQLQKQSVNKLVNHQARVLFKLVSAGSCASVLEA